MKKTQRIVGQILLAIGVTLTIGGIASLFFENIELRFIGNIIATDAGKAKWIVANLLISCLGLFLWRNSITKNNAP